MKLEVAQAYCSKMLFALSSPRRKFRKDIHVSIAHLESIQRDVEVRAMVIDVLLANRTAIEQEMSIDEAYLRAVEPLKGIPPTLGSISADIQSLLDEVKQFVLERIAPDIQDGVDCEY